MADSKYLDTLSTGMRVRIDPAYRLTKQRGLAEIVVISRDRLDSSEHHSSLQPAAMRKSLDELKLRITKF